MLLIQVYLQIIPIHLALAVKLQLPCHFHNPQYCLHPPRYDERQCFQFNVKQDQFQFYFYACHLKTYSILTVKKSELSGVFWSKLSRKWKDSQKIYVFFSGYGTIMTDKRQKNYFFFHRDYFYKAKLGATVDHYLL